MALVAMGCWREHDLTRFKLSPYSPEFAIPLVDDEVTMEKIVAELVTSRDLGVNAEGFYEFTFNGLMVSPTLEEVLPFPDKDLGAWQFPAPANNAGVTNDFGYELGNQSELTFVITKEGEISFQVQNQTNKNALLLITLPGVAIDDPAGNRPEVAVISPANSTQTGRLNLAKLRIPFTGSTGQPNTLRVRARVSYSDPSGLTGTFRIQPTVSNLKFKFVEGWLGNYTYKENFQTDIDVKIFNNKYGAAADGIQFENPRLKGEFLNNSGTPVDIVIRDVYTSPDREGNQKDWITDNNGSRIVRQNVVRFGTTIPANADSVRPNGVTYRGTFQNDSIDKSNSNVAEAFKLFGALPKKVFYTVQVKGTENRSAWPGRRYFGYDTSRVRVNGKAILPCDGRLYSFTIIDTFNIGLPKPEGENIGKLDFAEVAVRLTNGFPSSIEAQLLLADENGVVIDSVVTPVAGQPFNKLFVQAAPVSGAPDFKVTQRVVGDLRYFPIPAARYNNLQAKVRKAYLIARMRGPAGTPADDPNTLPSNFGPQKRIRIYPEYSMRSQIGISFSFKSDL